MEPASILVVEDDQTIALGLEYALAQEGYAVTYAASCALASQAIADKHFDLALLDINLPDGNGFDLCRLLRASGDTAVIFLTVQDDEAGTVMGLEMGAEDYITKPFRLRELLARIKVVLRRRGDAAPSTANLGGLTVDIARGKVTRNGEEIPLTAMEYRLLLVFLNNRGRILTRESILSGLWDTDGNFVENNTLTVYIKRLREKLEADPQNPRLIKTVRGLGYRMEE